MTEPALAPAPVAPAPRELPRIVVHVCRGCLRQSATYLGSIPRRWVRRGDLVFCWRCS